VAGILLTGLLYGRAGLREFRSRLLKWRVGARWYAVALLTAPLWYIAVLLALSLVSREFLPGIFASDDKASVLLFGIAVGLGAGFVEELGWTGFATPTLLGQRRYGVLGTGLIVGVLWGAWHFLTTLWGSGTSSGELSLAILLPGVLFAVGILPAYRVLIVWVYDRTGSLLVAMLMHVSLTASMLILGPLATGAALATYELVFAATLWLFVAAVAVAQGGHLTRQPPLRRRVAG
jgi:membrane protease YdiL (CAAX protease family)